VTVHGARIMNVYPAKISCELQALAYLSRPRLTADQRSELRQLVGNIDVKRLHSLIDHHRVWPCVYCNIRDHFQSCFPQVLVTYLGKRYQQNINHSRRQFSAYTKLLHCFSNAQIPMHSLKGIPLAQKLYGDCAKRHSHDIDILVPTDCVDLAHRTLQAQGFQSPPFDTLHAKQRACYFVGNKDITYTDENGVVLELHTRLCEYKTPLSLSGATAMLSREPLTGDHEMIYLCWHGAHTLFHRIKWLLDIALYLESMANVMEQKSDSMLRHAEQNDELRSLLVSWILCHKLYGITLPHNIEHMYRRDWVSARLVKMSLAMLENPAHTYTWRGKIEGWLCGFLFSKSVSVKIKKIMHAFRPNINLLTRYPGALGKPIYYSYILRLFDPLHRWLWGKP